jgi:dipeptidyl aminopeptidase/acylaminoacyl peptidase
VFGRVEEIAFKASDGHSVVAGLYLPPNYEPDRVYPLVIQTHGWTHNRFWINGPFTTAFAAQPLAGRGIVVAQLDEDYSRVGTSGEIPYEASAYEGVIDYLATRGLVDRDRVGIVAFSRTGLAAEWALTLSKTHFAVASLDDISDAGYFRYLALLNTPERGNGADNERINGGLPFGEGLKAWVDNSPGFKLDRITAPIRLIANQPVSLLFEWEWFVGLSRLGKAVELDYIADGTHVLVKPSDRIVSQGGNVDWFDFWLNGHEDPDFAKTEQYERWEKLCDMQKAQNPNRPTFCVRTKTH